MRKVCYVESEYGYGSETLTFLHRARTRNECFTLAHHDYNFSYYSRFLVHLAAGPMLISSLSPCLSTPVSTPRFGISKGFGS